MIADEIAATETAPAPRFGRVLGHLGIATSSWYRPAMDEGLRKRTGPPAKPIAEQVVQAVVTMATQNPWYGYKRIAVMCRRAGHAVKNREAYIVMRDHRLLQKPREQPKFIKLHGSSSSCRRSRTIFGRWMSPTSTSPAMGGGTPSP